MMDRQSIKLALVDDHTLFRRGMISLIKMVYPNSEILFEADNGKDLQQKLTCNNEPDVMLMDVNMPVMNGFESAKWLNANYPKIKVLVVSMSDNEASVIRMLKLGVKGYLSKDVEPGELGEAIDAIMKKGFYYSDFITCKLVDKLLSKNIIIKTDPFPINLINAKERCFLELACSDLTYNEIAAKMLLSPKTIDGYRDSLFEKLQVKNRIGMALYAIKHGLIKL